jgi:sigma-54 dependent transcriptional regulator, acetoin dehydrogenase operon transcriptional activator AcoR
MAVVVRETESRAELSHERCPGAPLAGRSLFDSCRDLAALPDTAAVVAAIPRLAAELCVARSAHLLELETDGTATVVAAHGVSVSPPEEQLVRRALWTLDRLPRVESYLHTSSADEAAAIGDAESLLAVSIARKGGPRLVLFIEAEPGGSFDAQDLGVLQVFAFVCSNSLARAQADAELRAAQAMQTAVVGSVQDSVIVLDASGIVRALSNSAATMIGRRRSETIGKRLRDLPGLAPLALSISAGTHAPDTATLSTGEVKLHVRHCEGGRAVTLVPVARGEPGAGGARFALSDLLGESPLMLRARQTAQRMSDSRLPILITGETGTGKEILAQAIHNASTHAAQPFVGVNVSAIPRELLESELFGYESGAFTGAATHGRKGKFELAQSGTILLDEVGEMPLEMQAKLLRVLQERVVQRLGGAAGKPFFARIIASTNRDLEAEVAAGRFRLDLLHRLRVVHVELPPLRERAGDIRLLAMHHLRVLARSTGRTSIYVTPQVMSALEAYGWPGNVRELVNMLDYEVRMLAPDSDVIDAVPATIERSLRQGGGAAAGGERPMTLEAAEREACIRALQKTDGNVARAARLLGVVKATLYSKMRRYGIPHVRTEPGIATDPGISRQRGPTGSDKLIS